VLPKKDSKLLVLVRLRGIKHIRAIFLPKKLPSGKEIFVNPQWLRMQMHPSSNSCYPTIDWKEV